MNEFYVFICGYIFFLEVYNVIVVIVECIVKVFLSVFFSFFFFVFIDRCGISLGEWGLILVFVSVIDCLIFEL